MTFRPETIFIADITVKGWSRRMAIGEP